VCQCTALHMARLAGCCRPGVLRAWAVHYVMSFLPLLTCVSVHYVTCARRARPLLLIMCVPVHYVRVPYVQQAMGNMGADGRGGMTNLTPEQCGRA